MDDFDLEDGFNGDILIIAVAADPEEWLPQIVIGIPVENEDGEVDSVAPVSLTPEEAYQIGAYLIQAAGTVSSIYSELVEKTVEERKEILSLEAQFLDSPNPF
jgi:hypothetical protein